MAPAAQPATSHSTSAHYTDMPDETPAAAEDADGHQSLSRANCLSPTCCIPAKACLKLDLHKQEQVVSHDADPPGPSMTEVSPIASFPTTNQPVMDIQLKEMLLTLHNSCHADIHTLMKQFTREIYSLGDRVPTIKESMGEMTTTINDLVEANDKNIEEHA